MLLSVFAWSLPLLGALSLDGNAPCPTPARVQELAAPAMSGQLHASARIDETETGVVLTLRDGSGAVIAQRDYPRSDQCESLAQGMAATLAIWVTQLEAQLIEPQTPAEPRPPAPKRAAPKPPAPKTAAPRPVPPAQEPAPAAPATAPEPETNPNLHLGLGAALTAESSPHPALRGYVGFSAAPELVLLLNLQVNARRNRSLPNPANRSARLEWRSDVLTVGAAYQLGFGPGFARAGASAGFGRLSASGLSFDENLTVTSLEPVGEGGVTFGYAAGPVIPWFSGGAQVWLRERSFVAETAGNAAGDVNRGPSTQLGQVEVWMALGLGVLIDL